MEIGIALYDIELHGCLNGVYTNNGSKGEIYNEVARLKHNTQLGVDGLSGEYDCFYFGLKNAPEGRWLIITIKTKIKVNGMDVYSYEFLWKDKDQKDIFKGIGYKMNGKQIAVHYEYLLKQ